MEETTPKKEVPQINFPNKTQETKKEIIQIEKSQPLFSLGNEIAKVKISVPFSELLKNSEYRAHIVKMLKAEEGVDSLNLQDDHPTIMFGPKVEDQNDLEDVRPFYIS